MLTILVKVWPQAPSKSSMWRLALLSIVASRVAIADPPCRTPEAAQKKLAAITVANHARFDAALAKQHTKLAKVSRKMRAAGEENHNGDQVGDELMFSTSRSCSGNSMTDGFQFAIDSKNRVYLLTVTTKLKSTELSVCGCRPDLGAQPPPEAGCGTGPQRVVATFGLPPHAVFKGDLAINYTVEEGWLSYVKQCPQPSSNAPASTGSSSQPNFHPQPP
jgi:hypothetical protein